MYSCLPKVSAQLSRRRHYHISSQLYGSTTVIKERKLDKKNIHKKDDTTSSITVGQQKEGFTCKDLQYIPEYNMTAILLEHNKTKTEYLHIDREDPNNVFSVGFRTTPLDSMGTPHILEHTVLCGSKKYPVRDPFFKMLNRSLATFMNALTGPDYTFYPFSSQNQTDFKNLQKVYLDAVFNPNLRRLDFLQEGWRLEHSKLDDKSSPLTFKGVVYNEMKGAFSDTNSLFGRKFMNKILPEGTYGVCSGGDPIDIPNLTHKDLVNFHAKYYHPSNARIYSYGNFPLEASLKFCNENYLTNYEYLDPKHSLVNPQSRWEVSKQDTISCRFDEYGSPIEKQNQIAFGYLMSDVKDINETFMLLALAELMIIGPNSAFYKSLIEKNISGGYNGLTGYDNQLRDTLFIIGLKDLEKSKFSEVERIVNDTINKICDKGFEKDHIESVLHGFELSIKHQSPKFGLNLLFNLMPLWNHNGPIIEALKVNNLLDTLKINIAKPDYLQNAVKKYFSDNNHKLIMTMEPDADFDNKSKHAEAELLDCKVKNLTEKDKAEIYEDGLTLAKIQKQKENLDSLPCLKIDEIKLTKTAPILKHITSSSIPIQLCEANTNGVTYFKGVLNTEQLTKNQFLLLPFFSYVASKFDTKNFNYRDLDKHISKCTSGLGFQSHLAEHIDQNGKYEQSVVISSYALDQNVAKMMDIWKEIFDLPKFDNTERIDMLLKSYCSSLTNGIVSSGHAYAMQSARSLISSTEKQKELLSGLQHVNKMQNLIKKSDAATHVQETVRQVSQKVLSAQNLRLAFHHSKTTDLTRQINDFVSYITKGDILKEPNTIKWFEPSKFPKKNNCVHIQMNIPVNFCAKAIPTVTYTHPDFAKLRVLSRFLTSKFLHVVVREQNGAYGGGANLSTEGIFNFYSYRDPNSRVTLDAFDNSATWLKDNAKILDDETLFEAKLSILQAMDQPTPEYMKGIDYFLYGLSYDHWKTQRERVLAVTRQDLFDVCEKYLNDTVWYGKCVLGQAADKSLEQDGEFWSKINGPQN